MSDDGNVIDLATVRVTRDSHQDFEQVLRASLREAVAGIATMHPNGKSEAWIDAKAEASAAVIIQMTQAAMKPLPIPLPDSISDADRSAIAASSETWGRAQNEACRSAFADHLVALLAP